MDIIVVLIPVALFLGLLGTGASARSTGLTCVNAIYYGRRDS